MLKTNILELKNKHFPSSSYLAETRDCKDGSIYIQYKLAWIRKYRHWQELSMPYDTSRNLTSVPYHTMPHPEPAF